MSLKPAHNFARVAIFIAMVAVALPQVAAAQESAAAGTAYDKKLYERLVSDGTPRDEARCASAIAGATVKLERRNSNGYFLRRGRRRPGDHAERQPAADR